jgi:hypothetical protein
MKLSARPRTPIIALTALLGLLAASCGSELELRPATAAAEVATMARAAHTEAGGAGRAQATTRIPIFIITCDRLTVLKETMASLERGAGLPYEVVIHDNHSTFPPMLAYLDALEAQGITVVRHDEDVIDVAQLDNVRQTIDAWYRTHDAPYYAVTDPDVALEDDTGRSLAFYAQLLEHYPQYNVAGPLLKVDDLPDYPFKEEAVTGYRIRFSNVPVLQERFDGGVYGVVPGAIDTTFGMYRKSFGFHRLNEAIMARSPFAARHLDWYIDPTNMADDQVYYMRHASDVSHVGGPWMREYVDRTQHGEDEDGQDVMAPLDVDAGDAEL